MFDLKKYPEAKADGDSDLDDDAAAEAEAAQSHHNTLGVDPAWVTVSRIIDNRKTRGLHLPDDDDASFDHFVVVLLLLLLLLAAVNGTGLGLSVLTILFDLMPSHFFFRIRSGVPCEVGGARLR